MIPKFKTYMNESVWGDFRKKSLGLEKRIEDNVDEMGFNEFYGYVESHYKDKVYNVDQSVVSGSEGYHTCEVYFTEDVYLLIYFYDKESQEQRITFFWEKVGIEQDFIKKLGDNFNIEVSNFGFINIIVDDVYRSNSTYIRLLDFILENQDKMIMESVWADIRKKSLGTEERKEDNIEMLFNILDNTYFSRSRQSSIEMDENTITVPLFFDNVRQNRSLKIRYDKDGKKNITIDSWIKKVIDKESHVLSDKYKIISTYDNFGYEIFNFIFPKDGKDINDDFCIDVIDTIISNIPSIYSKLIKRK